MVSKALARTGLLGLALLSAVPALAEDGDLVNASDPKKIAEIFRGFGSARMDKAADDTPAIRGRIEGNMFSVYFYGCNDKAEACSTLNLTASWETAGAVTLEQINDWNRDKRFGRAYLDKSGNAVVETDVILSGSTTYANMESSVDWWRVTMADFKENVIDAPAASGAAPEAGAAPSEAPPVQTGEATGETESAPKPGGAPRGPFAIPRKPNPGN